MPVQTVQIIIYTYREHAFMYMHQIKSNQFLFSQGEVRMP